MFYQTIVRIVLAAGLLVAVGGVAAAGSHGDEQPLILPLQITEDWQGLWEFDYEARDCDTQILLFTDQGEMVFCEGQGFNPTDEEDIDCTTEVTPTTFYMVCTYQGVTSPTCIANTTMTLDYVMGVDSFTGTQTILNEYVGDCGVDETCIEMTINATLVDPDPVECEPQSNTRLDWGGLKAVYR